MKVFEVIDDVVTLSRSAVEQLNNDPLPDPQTILGCLSCLRFMNSSTGVNRLKALPIRVIEKVDVFSTISTDKVVELHPFACELLADKSNQHSARCAR